MPRLQPAKDQFQFRDRSDAGRRLAERIGQINLPSPLVLALPRGGVPVGLEIAKKLHAPLDLLLVRKLGVPWQPELAVGAVLDGDRPQTIINQPVARALHIDEGAILQIARDEMEEIERRRRSWLAGRQHVPMAGRSVIVVDDGVATGTSVRVALHAVRAQKPARSVLAVPVAAGPVAESLREMCDDLVVLATPADLVAVGFYYQDFHQLEDAEVASLLNQAWASLPAR